MKKIKCKLPFYKISSNIASLAEAKQKCGWEITAFNLPESWKHCQGEGVKIAILDTGCDLDHPDLVENLIPGINIINTKKPPEDDNMHGTHVTGILCASNNEIGMVGVAPKSKVIPVKVLDKNGSGDLSIVSEGIRWAVDNGAEIIGMSLGSPRPTQELRKSIQYADSKGIPVFCAAGNAGRTREIFYPANYPETIAIGSIDENFDRSAFSNTGDDLDFMAPGANIFSTVPDNWYAVLSGTSMACPFAVGVAALLLSYVKSHKTSISLTCASDYRNALKTYATSINSMTNAGKKFFQGFGIIDPRKLDEWMDQNS
jgi:subtilisin